MKALLKFAEKVFTILVLILSTEAVFSVVSLKGESELEGNPLLRVLWMGSYGITLCLLAVQWKGFTRIPRKLDKIILILTGVAVFSYFWSASPQLTLRRSVALIGTTLFGVYLGTRYNPREQLRLIAWALGIGAVLSLLFAVFLPIYGVDPGFDVVAWRGVYSQKNSLGRYMVLSSLVFLLIAFSSSKHRWVAWSGLGLSVGLLVMSTSKTSLVVLLAVLILLPFYRAIRWSYTLSIPIFIIAILLLASIVILFTAEAETVLGFIGKDLTLTGRTDLWAVVFTMIQQRFWLGYGYSAFWLGWEGYSADVWKVFNWLPNHAHNGFLDIWLDLGLLGLSIFILSFFNSLVKAVAWVRHTKTLEYCWPIVYLTVILLYNLTYSTLIDQNSLFWILYVSINVISPVQNYRPAKLPISTLPNKEKWV